jgi:hypothetical protein
MIENLEGEIWKPVVGYEGKYAVSNKGRVKSLNYKRSSEERLMSPRFHKGYAAINLLKNGVYKAFKIHRLVYESFVGELPNYKRGGRGEDILEINHKDENRANNYVENLELISHKGNVNYGSHSRKVALATAKAVYQYTKDMVLVRIWESTKECGRNGFSGGNVNLCCNNKYHREGNNFYRGFHWSYVPLN